MEKESFHSVQSLSRVRLSNPMDCSLPDSTVHGIFQARVLEWGAIAFSKIDKADIYIYINSIVYTRMYMCVCVYTHTHIFEGGTVKQAHM